MLLVIGLGNPGAEYTSTRHNVGFLVVDSLARRTFSSIDRQQHGAKTAKVRWGDSPLILAKPMKFMNRSGGPAQALRGFYKLSLDQVVVIHDDLELPFGTVKVKLGGGHGGHNGLRDLHKHLGGNDYVRVRVGVSRPPPGWKPADYVLGRWSAEQANLLEDVVNMAADAVDTLVHSGIHDAIERFNSRGPATVARAS
jgi:PTH1 family peptidyl-tRNA hydrolase